MYNEYILDVCNDDLRNALKVFCNNNNKDKSLNRPVTNVVKPLNRTYRLDEHYPLHYFAFHNDWQHFIEYYTDTVNCPINQMDPIGNTPLIIAAKKGHKNFIDLLLFLNVDVSIKNCDGWGAIAESISYGDIRIVENMLKLFNIQNHLRLLDSKKKKDFTVTNRDFMIEFSWDIKTWIPILSKFLPSDNCKLTKSGSKLRLDQTLMDFTDHSWHRGNISCIINPNLSSNSLEIFLLDNEKKTYQILNLYEDSISKEDIVSFMSSDIIDPKIDTSNVNYTPRINFWSFGYQPIRKMVGKFNATMYDVTNIRMTLRHRREHISKKQTELNKLLKKNTKEDKFKFMKNKQFELLDFEPPSVSDITWSDYKDAVMSNISPHIGRKLICKTKVKEIKLSVGMSEDFPLRISEILDVFGMILPEKKLNRIRDIFSMKLPPGFPVTMDIPIVPTVNANISFLKAQVGCPHLSIADSLFLIPDNYTLVNKI